ncbi:hypothetical protein PYW08_009125 [Mythimna loreyi]|uniref:Uncharacterized protein n=1 Tax=Mythimna loreyi TaxID=667449 RepID=A0ACC2Q8W7_9NEOP|nr:hypothetical protein PYW08_009125 [Mythimna loreyi]
MVQLLIDRYLWCFNHCQNGVTHICLTKDLTACETDSFNLNLVGATHSLFLLNLFSLVNCYLLKVCHKLLLMKYKAQSWGLDEIFWKVLFFLIILICYLCV